MLTPLIYDSTCVFVAAKVLEMSLVGLRFVWIGCRQLCQLPPFACFRLCTVSLDDTDREGGVVFVNHTKV